MNYPTDDYLSERAQLQTLFGVVCLLVIGFFGSKRGSRSSDRVCRLLEANRQNDQLLPARESDLSSELRYIALNVAVGPFIVLVQNAINQIAFDRYVSLEVSMLIDFFYVVICCCAFFYSLSFAVDLSLRVGSKVINPVV